MSETTKMRAPYDDSYLAHSLGGYVEGSLSWLVIREVLAYRERFGAIDAPPKSPQAGDGVWLGDCEPNTHAQLRDRAKLLDDIAALRAEVERRDEIIACEVGLRESASAEAAARTVEANSLRGRTLNAESEAATAKAEAARYRRAIVTCIRKIPPTESAMLRVLAFALLTDEERGA